MLQQLDDLQKQLDGLAEASDAPESSEVGALVAQRNAIKSRMDVINAQLEAETDGIVQAMRQMFPQDYLRMRDLPEPACVLPYLYLGGEEEAECVSPLKDLGISGIVNCVAGEYNASWRHTYPGDWSYLAFDASDECDYPMIPHHFEAFQAFVAAARQTARKVLVHCVAGINRSAALCIAHLIAEGRTLVEAFETVYSVRPIVLSNAGFCRQLVDFARQCEHTSGDRRLPMDAELSDFR